MRFAMWWVIATAGCLRSETVVCSDFVCPQGTECDDVHGLCIDREQRTACEGMADGATCTTALRAGICDQSVCLPGCTDGVQDAGEECDDGNRRDHDGCSAACVTEVPTWTEWQSPWTPRSGHMVAYDSVRKRIVVFGGIDANGTTDDLWERDEEGGWHKLDIARPPPRSGGAMAYDPVRAVTVLFGGASKFGALLRDTWEYDGTTWREVMPATSPSARSASAMVFDPIRARIVLVAGFDGVDIAQAGHVGDVWHYNGVTWSSVATTGPAPAPRRAHGLAWDTPRQRLVMYGGIRPNLGTTAATSETWELSFGTSWTWTCTAGEAPCPNVTRPSPRYGVAMTYSEGHNNSVLLFGGLALAGPATLNASDTWIYGASGWVAQSQAISPGGRSTAALTAVEVKENMVLVKRAVLIAGATDVGASDEIWESAAPGASWVRMLTPGNAPARYGVSLVHDLQRDRTLTIAGYFPPLVRADAFSFDGKVWRRILPLPALRYGLASTYDSTRDRVVLFGGLGLSSTRSNETYVLTGLVWNQVPGAAPPARYGAAFAHDPRTGASVLFGGNDAAGALLGDTWELDDVVWTQNTAAGGPTPQLDAAMAFDPVRQELVLVDVNGQTWLYSNRRWTRLDTLASPPPRSGARLVFNPSRRRLVLFGGIADSGTTTEVLGDMWELDTDGDQRVWREVAFANGPPPRGAFGLAAHVSLDALVLRAGITSSGQPLGDTWLFQYRAEE
jgi:cysteine-rich repeat protein